MGLLRWATRRTKMESRRWEPLLHTPRSSSAYYDGEGRRHRGDVPYLLPKDEQEIQRLNYQHYLFRSILHGNCFAPVEWLLKNGCTVLDVGCGTGRWGCEIASHYTHSQVIGFDLEELSHQESKPLNYVFEQGNLLANQGLPFRTGQFAYVHQRLLGAALPLASWPWVIQELKRVTRPGGWVELIEMGNTFHRAGPATEQMLAWWMALSATKGIETSQLSLIGEFLQRAGFLPVQKKTQLIPLGSWGGRVGNLLAQDMLSGWPSMRPALHTLCGISPTYFDAVMADLEREWNSKHTQYEVYCACGQHPGV
ncbi:MAG TPA: class I SAM-dependent methyltransferase [Ktedonobacteraceae bacterium]|nr:class I SAM-dependent methyltransferase [Ktedonobacteraceae bacterium]